MTGSPQSQTRRGVVIAVLAAVIAFAAMIAGARATAQSGRAAKSDGGQPAGNLHDWDFLVGRWTVRHHRLKARLAGSTEWEDFAGTCVNWPTLGGQGNVDDNTLELPGGTYRGVGIRAYDAGSGQWSIWWLDSRKSTMDPPVKGGFKDGVGTFVGDDTLDGRPIKMRFRWSKITPTSAHWEQAFSPDSGATWETNWTMEFTRVKP